MSTIATTNLKHPSSVTNNITLASTGAVAINGTMTGAGLDLITTQTFTASSSISINNCFTSQYENYRVICTTSAASTQNSLRLRFRSGGSDSSANAYYFSAARVSANNTTAVWTSGATTYSEMVPIDSNYPSMAMSIEFYGPMTATPLKRFTTLSATAISGISLDSQLYGGGGFGSASTFDGFSLFTSTGTVTGKIAVYGYKSS